MFPSEGFYCWCRRSEFGLAKYERRFLLKKMEKIFKMEKNHILAETNASKTPVKCTWYVGDGAARTATVTSSNSVSKSRNLLLLPQERILPRQIRTTFFC
jgi:hypothetical protein